MEDAFRLLRCYAHSSDQHLTDVARRLITEPDKRTHYCCHSRASAAVVIYSCTIADIRPSAHPTARRTISAVSGPSLTWSAKRNM